jgi:hypothetical protein
LVFGWLALSSDEYAEALQDAADLGIVGGDIYDAMRVPYWFFTERLRVVALTTIQ